MKKELVITEDFKHCIEFYSDQYSLICQDLEFHEYYYTFFRKKFSVSARYSSDRDMYKYTLRFIKEEDLVEFKMRFIQ